MRERLVPFGGVVAAGVKRVAQHRHRRLAGRSRQRRVEPGGFLIVDRSHDAGVDGDEREPVGLHLEEGRSLKSGGHAVFAAQASRFGDQALDPALGRAGHPQVALPPARECSRGRRRPPETSRRTLRARRTSRDCPGIA